jgi:hypothetical protein
MLQLIETQDEYKSINKYIKSFDMDILENYYDGNMFYIKNLNGIINKQAIYNETFFTSRSFGWIINRISKYYKRGYQIHFGTNFLLYAHNLEISFDKKSDHNYYSMENRILECYAPGKNTTNGLMILLNYLDSIKNTKQYISSE